MRYRECDAREPLGALVRCFWSLEGRAGVGGMERVLPDAHAELILHLGGRFRRFLAPGESQTQPRAFLMGEIDRPVILQPEAEACVFGIRLRPGAVSALLPGSASEWIGRSLKLDEIWGASGRQLLDDLGEAAGFQERVRQAETWLLSQLGDRCSLESRVQAAMIELTSGSGLDGAAAAAEVGSRQMERLFQTHIGLSPKRVQRLLRFQSAARALLREARPLLAGVALDCGYSDQAHLTREFGEFAGITPAAFLASEEELVGLFQGPDVA